MARIIVGDTIYEINTEYREGAKALRAGTPNICCPYRLGSYAYDQWNAGHCHEDEGEHIRFGQDIITARKPKNFVWEEDKNVPRDHNGCVVMEWYYDQLEKLGN